MGFSVHPLLAPGVRYDSSWTDFDSVADAWQNVADLIDESWLEVQDIVEAKQKQAAQQTLAKPEGGDGGECHRDTYEAA
jgi:hypothetical protein